MALNDFKIMTKSGQKKTLAPHSFHIPVMGTAFTIDTPIKIAKYGVSSVISIGDDELCENIRKYYCQQKGYPYTEIKKWDKDRRARRITAYLNVVHRIVKEEFETLRQSRFEPGSEITEYFELLKEGTPLKVAYRHMLERTDPEQKAADQRALRSAIVPGRIDTNIMTKIDRTNYTKSGDELSDEFADAVAALRGFADSEVEGGVVFSAGFNRRLYAYIANCPDFFPDENGHIKKEVILKVSDYRSSLIQGKFLAKKGVWVSEYRIESGLNCGGHAFATDGYLLGPIMEEFKEKRIELGNMLFDVCNQALQAADRHSFSEMPTMRITVQGGIGTSVEDSFLLDHYELDGTGWASPFLLVPEVTILDDKTRQQLCDAGKKDLYLSGISPLGVPFNTVRGTESERQKLERVSKGEPGSPCPKGHLVSNTEFTKRPICTASRTYQRLKIKALKALSLSEEEYDSEVQRVVNKACLCEDLAASALITNQIENKRSLTSAVCPGPNLAYFSKISTFSEMVGHIYGKLNLLNDTYRPNLFISELKMYIDYLSKEIKKSLPKPHEPQLKKLREFRDNLLDGIEYYKTLVPAWVMETKKYRDNMREELNQLYDELQVLIASHKTVFSDYIQKKTPSSSVSAA